jgi:hypothetical protein
LKTCAVPEANVYPDLVAVDPNSKCGSISNETVFDSGEWCEMRCADGYDQTSATEENYTCMGDTFTPPAIVCTPSNCNKTGSESYFGAAYVLTDPATSSSKTDAVNCTELMNGPAGTTLAHDSAVHCNVSCATDYYAVNASADNTMSCAYGEFVSEFECRPTFCVIAAEDAVNVTELNMTIGNASSSSKQVDACTSAIVAEGNTISTGTTCEVACADGYEAVVSSASVTISCVMGELTFPELVCVATAASNNGTDNGTTTSGGNTGNTGNTSGAFSVGVHLTLVFVGVLMSLIM